VSTSVSETVTDPAVTLYQASSTALPGVLPTDRSSCFSSWTPVPRASERALAS
jgi:hypothetical protein